MCYTFLIVRILQKDYLWYLHFIYHVHACMFGTSLNVQPHLRNRVSLLDDVRFVVRDSVRVLAGVNYIRGPSPLFTKPSLEQQLKGQLAECHNQDRKCL